MGTMDVCEKTIHSNPSHHQGIPQKKRKNNLNLMVELD